MGFSSLQVETNKNTKNHEKTRFFGTNLAPSFELIALSFRPDRRQLSRNQTINARPIGGKSENQSRFLTSPRGMGAPTKTPGWISLRALSLRHGMSHGFFSACFTRGQMVGCESRRLGNRVLLREDETLEMTVKSLLARDGRPLRFAAENNSARSRAEFLLAVAKGEKSASELDKVVAGLVLRAAVFFFENRAPGERARLFGAAAEFATRALALKRQDSQQSVDLLASLAAAIYPLSQPSPENQTR
jgi:hypothetical protein